MNSFVRFVFTVLGAGMALNVLIVLMANAHSASRQAHEMGLEREALTGLVDKVDGRLRRADIIVESQEVDALGTALRSTLLVREYASTSSDQSNPLPMARVEIPGNKLCVDGLVLKFGTDFADDAPDLQILRGRTLAYFGHVYGEEQGGQINGIFSFLRQWEAPELTRLEPSAARPTYYEQKLWPYVWRIVKDPPAPDKEGSTASRRGVEVEWTAPAERAVRLEHTYSAYIGPEGAVSIEEDSAVGMPGLLDAMLEAGRKQLGAEGGR